MSQKLCPEEFPSLHQASVLGVVSKVKVNTSYHVENYASNVGKYHDCIKFITKHVIGKTNTHEKPTYGIYYISSLPA